MPRATWRDYLTLTKPRIMVLLLITGAGGMVVGAGGVPPAGPHRWRRSAAWRSPAAARARLTTCSTATSTRTWRARPSGRWPPAACRRSGRSSSASPSPRSRIVVLTSFVNVLAALLALAGNLFYVIVYTRWLKRSTPQNIVIGGAAGAVPPLVGYAAATGNLTLPRSRSS